MNRFASLEFMKGARRSLVVAALAGMLLPISGTAFATVHHKAKPAAPVAPGTCGPTPERSSIGIRALQTELMVAGLKCSAEEWNSFTAKFQATIKKDADRMQGVFAKAYGKSGASHMNSFVTQLANDASSRSNNMAEVDYCKQEEVLFQRVLALTADDLERFSVHRALAVPAPVKLCDPEPDAPPITTASATQATPAAAQPAVARSPASSPAGKPAAH